MTRHPCATDTHLILAHAEHVSFDLFQGEVVRGYRQIRVSVVVWYPKAHVVAHADGTSPPIPFVTPGVQLPAVAAAPRHDRGRVSRESPIKRIHEPNVSNSS